MQKYTAKTTLAKYRKELVHREAMCSAIASMPDEPKAAEFGEIATRSRAAIDAIDARTLDLRRSGDLLTQGRALERTSKLYGKKGYAQLRLDFMARAEDLFRSFLPLPPSALDKMGAKRAVAMVEASIASISSPDTPESIRTEHVPAMEAHLTRMREADLTEDDAQLALSTLRAGIIRFKAELQRDRETVYGLLVTLVGKVDAEEFFLKRYSRSRDADELEEEEDELEGGDTDNTDSPAPVG